MFLWFCILAPVLVAEVFQSPLVDFRIVMLFAVVPLLEIAIGGPYVLHSLLAAVVALTAVMLLFRGRRLRQRQLLGIPIGLFMHSVLDGVWQTKELFWWPAFGFSFDELVAPEAERDLGVLLGMEAVAVIIAFWAYRRYELDVADNRKRLLATGHLSRTALP